MGSPETDSSNSSKGPVSGPSAKSSSQATTKGQFAIDGMTEVENLIRSKLGSDAERITEIASYLLDLGGKRIRPLITLLSGAAFGMTPPTSSILEVAAGIELIHMATLLHDDIIDKSQLRRHKTSPFARFGPDDTLLTGDFLLTRAFSLCAHLDKFIIERTEFACIALTEGEILEVPLHKKKHSIESSTVIARKKTAALFRLACECGAHLAGAGKEATEAFGFFGEELGIAFQILDDILDVTSTAEILGKPPGIDLIERKPSLINVLWLNSGDSLSAMLLKNPDETPSDFASRAISAINSSPVLAEARAEARKRAESGMISFNKAIALAPRIDKTAVENMRALVEYSLNRLS